MGKVREVWVIRRIKLKKKGSDKERYSRQMLLEEWDQKKLHDSCVLIAGIGALGSVVALNLAMMGVGELIIVDFDTVELSNLSKQLLYREEDLGKPKVEVARKKLQEVNSEIKIVALNKDIRKVDRSYFERCNVVVDGLDNFEVRRWLNSMCVTLSKPLVHGGFYGWYGNVQVVIPLKTACLECQPLIPPEKLQKMCTPPGRVRRKVKVEEEKIPTVASIATVIGGIQTQEVLKILLGIPNILENYVFYDGVSQSLTKIKLERNPECVVCSDKYRIEGVDYMLERQETLNQLKNRLIITYGLASPEIMVKGKMISDGNLKISDLGLKTGDVIFIIDERLAKPLKLKIKIT